MFIIEVDIQMQEIYFDRVSHWLASSSVLSDIPWKRLKKKKKKDAVFVIGSSVDVIQ